MAISVANEANVYDLRGLSTDTKPVNNLGGGSTFFECDTGEVYIFDIDHKIWVKI